MSAIYRISQNGVDGDWGVARLDLTLYPVGGIVSLEAQDQDLNDTYQWEIISEPYGSTAAASLTVPDPVNAPWLATLELDVTGGCLGRLIYNAGQADEDISILYLGVALANSGLCIPAFNETFFDNSSYAADGYKGYERKLTAFLKWCDANMFGGVAADVTVDTTNFDKNLTSSEDTVQKVSDAVDELNLGDYSSIYDPTSRIISLTADLSGCLHNTENTTASKGDPHEVTLPDPSPGLVFSVHRSTQLSSSEALTIEVNTPASQSILFPQRQVTETKIALLVPSTLVKLVAVSTTEWALDIQSGAVQLDPDAGIAEYDHANGLLVTTRGQLGDSPDTITAIADQGNEAMNGAGSWGQLGLALGWYARHYANGATTFGRKARTRELWDLGNVCGTTLDTGEDAAGQAQSSWGTHWIGKSVNGVEDTTGTSTSRQGIALDNNTITAFKGQVVAKCQDHEDACKVWEYEVVMAVDNSGNGTILSQTLTETAETAYMNEDTWYIDFDVAVFGVWDALASLKCNGEAGRTVYFVGTIETTELGVYTP